MQHAPIATATAGHSGEPIHLNLMLAEAGLTASESIAFVRFAHRPPVWSARCKSGYQFHGRTCNRPASRGELLCSECATAQVIATVTPDSLLARMARTVGGWVSSNEPWIAVACLALAGVVVQVVR